MIRRPCSFRPCEADDRSCRPDIGVVHCDAMDDPLSASTMRWPIPTKLPHSGAPDAADPAAAYAYGLARNHGFVDGNRRTAWIAARLFLADNGYRLSFDPFDAIPTMEGVAGGVVKETGLASWFRDRLSEPEQGQNQLSQPGPEVSLTLRTETDDAR
ncbi:MAG TPA: type II toxin-antitoxin system death-on-curing family toxin [Pseudomonadaceae bacterium]|nr:type II toxin-antitoxin system death-on-curing family toxin [Pseudomonadaceae bacterium]